MPVSATSSRAKRANTREDTRPELVLRSSLFRLGLRYRKNVQTLPGKPDVLFPRAKVAVFCDGDFWHGRRWEEVRENLGRGGNGAYWTAKIAANRARDEKITEQLEARGWQVVRVWETDVLRNHDVIAENIRAIVRSRSTINHGHRT